MSGASVCYRLYTLRFLHLSVSKIALMMITFIVPQFICIKKKTLALQSFRCSQLLICISIWHIHMNSLNLLEVAAFAERQNSAKRSARKYWNIHEMTTTLHEAKLCDAFIMSGAK